MEEQPLLSSNPFLRQTTKGKIKIKKVDDNTAANVEIRSIPFSGDFIGQDYRYLVCLYRLQKSTFRQTVVLSGRPVALAGLRRAATRQLKYLEDGASPYLYRPGQGSK